VNFSPVGNVLKDVMRLTADGVLDREKIRVRVRVKRKNFFVILRDSQGKKKIRVLVGRLAPARWHRTAYFKA